MTPVLCCGFECGVAGPHVTLSGTGGFTVDPQNHRSGTRALRANPSAVTPNDGGRLTATTAANTNVVRLYVFLATPPTATAAIATVVYGAVSCGAYYNASDGKVYAGDATTGLGVTGVTVSGQTWLAVDLKVNATSNPWTIDVTVEGSACGQKTHAAAAATSNLLDCKVVAPGTTTADVYWDDVVWSQTAGDYPIGAGYVTHFVPTSDGAHSTGTAGTFIKGAAGVNITPSTTDSYLLVDDIPIDDATPDTNDYVNQAGNGTTNYTEHIFGPAAGVSLRGDAPRAVEAIVAYHQAGTGVGVSELRLNDNGTENTIVALTTAGVTTTRYSRKHYALMPKDNAAWTLTRFQDLRIRFGYSSDANPDQYFDCAMLEAEFPPSTGTAVEAFHPRRQRRYTYNPALRR